MKRIIQMLGIALLGLAVIGCGGLFGPSPVIDSFTTSYSSVDAGDTVILNVTGTTLGAGEASTTDYSGTLTVTSSPGTYSQSRNIDGAFDEDFSVVMSSAGSYTFTATLVASDGTTVTDSVTVTVAAAPSTPYYSDLSLSTWVKGSVDTGTDEVWYRKQSLSSTYYVHWFDDVGTYDADVADIKVTIYGGSATTAIGSLTSLAASRDSSPSVAISTAGYDYIYIKVQPFYTSQRFGDFFLSIDNGITPPTSGTISYTGNTKTLTAGAIQVYSYDTYSTMYDFKFYDRDYSSSYTADIRASAFNGMSNPLFYSDDSYSATSHDNISVSTSYDLYMVIEGWSSTSSGSFYLALN